METQPIRENKPRRNRKWLIILLVFIIGGLFYWYEYRPSKIRKHCSSWASKETGQGTIKNVQEKYNLFYEKCLHEQGLK